MEANVKAQSGQQAHHEAQPSIKTARQMARQLDISSFTDGTWLLKVVQQLVRNYPYERRRQALKDAYGTASAEQIAAKRIQIAARKSALAGATVGLTITSSELVLLASLGMTATVLVSSVGAEIIYLAQLQINLVLELALIYDIPVDPDDTDLMMRVFNYALGSTLKNGLPDGSDSGNMASQPETLRATLARGGVRFAQETWEFIGLLVLQETLIKYAIPVAAIGIGAGYNYKSTSAVGKAADAYFQELQNGPE